jgi:hypothetical protein
LALTERLDDEAILRDICVGPGQRDDVRYYLDRPRHTGDFHDQARMLWVATERVQAGRSFSGD